MGNFSKEWFYLNCNVGHHCLGVKLKEPVFFDGQLTSRLYVTKIDDPELVNDLNKKTKEFSEDFNGGLLVWAFHQDLTDEQLIEIQMDNIDNVSIIK